MRRLGMMIAAAALLASCGGGSDDSGAVGTGTSNGSASGGDTSDNCALVSAQEATDLAGYELEVGEDSLLGCGFSPPDSGLAEIVVSAQRLDGDAASLAAAGFPEADEIIPLDVGSDTVAVTSPSGGAIAAIITTDDGRVLELTVIFLLIPPSDTVRVEAAAQLAVAALARWEG